MNDIYDDSKLLGVFVTRLVNYIIIKSKLKSISDLDDLVFLFCYFNSLDSKWLMDFFLVWFFFLKSDVWFSRRIPYSIQALTRLPTNLLLYFGDLFGTVQVTFDGSHSTNVTI